MKWFLIYIVSAAAATAAAAIDIVLSLVLLLLYLCGLHTQTKKNPTTCMLKEIALE